MDAVVIIGGIVLFVLIGPWVLAWRVNVKRRREREEDQGHWREFASRISALEFAVQKLQALRATPAVEDTATTSERPAQVPQTPSPRSPVVVSPPPTVEPVDSVRVAERWVTQRAAESVPLTESSTADRVIPPAHRATPTQPQPPVTPLPQ